MAKADLKLPNGTVVTVEGSPAEVAAVLEHFGGQAGRPAPGSAVTRRNTGSRRAARSTVAAGGRTRGPVDYIRELAAEGFFRSKRGLRDIQARLEERGNIYPVTSLSPALVRLVRMRELRRIKEDGRWKYINP